MGSTVGDPAEGILTPYHFYNHLLVDTGSGSEDDINMADQGHGRSYYRDDEIVVDRDGITHFTGAMPPKNLEGSRETDEAIERSLERKQEGFAKRLTDGLHGKAWEAVEELTAEPQLLRRTDGYEMLLQALTPIEKAGIVKKTESLD